MMNVKVSKDFVKEMFTGDSAETLDQIIQALPPEEEKDATMDMKHATAMVRTKSSPSKKENDDLCFKCGNGGCEHSFQKDLQCVLCIHLNS